MNSNFMKITGSGAIAISHDFLPGDSLHKAALRESSATYAVVRGKVGSTETAINVTINSAARGNYVENQAVKLADLGTTASIPSGYSELNYVHSEGRYCNVTPSGRGQHSTTYYELPFVDTGIIINSSYKYSVLMQMRSNTSAVNQMGLAYTNNYGFCQCGRDNSSRLVSAYTNQSLSTNTALYKTPTDANWHEYFMKYGRQSIDTTIKSYSYSGNMPRGSSGAVLSFYIGARAYNWGPTSPTSYYTNINNDFGLVVIWDSSGQCVKFYVPCVRDSDRVAGFYELVNNVFTPSNKSSYPFVAGRTVSKNTYLLGSLIY